VTQRQVALRPGLYRDSVRLMQISQTLGGLPGVRSCLVAMATGLNLELLAGMGFDEPADAGPNDMLVAIAADDEASLSAALTRLDAELVDSGGPAPAGGHGGPGGAPRNPRTVGAAVRASGAALALVSTPGRVAFVDAMDALDAGASVLLFSDNVPVDQEVRLKEAAAERGLIVMGPDCGTAVVGGVGLGFANVVRPGPVGIVAASGTGAQQVLTLLDAAGVGVSHCLGVGGRDLTAAVGGRSTHAALDALDADPDTRLILVIGKPPAPEVAGAVAAHAARLSTPVLVAPLGIDRPDLAAVVVDVLNRLGYGAPAHWHRWAAVRQTDPLGGGAVRGLFSGGTLCVEAMAIAAAALGPVFSNVPLSPEWTLDAAPADAHTMIDLGDDEFTVGRPHPMIDFGPRLERLAAQAADPHCGVLLLDVVLGHGAHPDPAAELAPAITSALAARPHLAVVCTLVGAAGDPQDYQRQANALRRAGAEVFAANAEAARYAVRLAAGIEAPIGPRGGAA
jgi:FdrA protein